MSKFPRVDPVAAEQAFTTTERDNASRILTPDQLQRWARLIAEGRGDLPENLETDSRDLLVAEVRRLLRVRLAHFFAHAIAVDLHRRALPGEHRPGGAGRRPDKEVK